MIRVKVSTSFGHWPVIRQTPDGSGVWGDCCYIFDEEATAEHFDFWVVLEGLTGSEAARCPPGNTLLVTCEPPGVKSYPAAFVQQFGTVISCHQTLPHPHVVHIQQGLPWMIGAELDARTLTWTNFMSFAELASRPIEKTKLLSIVASKDKATPGHIARNRLIESLRDALGDRVDVFGLGYLPIRDKWDAIAPYKYHLAVENSRVPDYWTEKLADAFLGEAFPLYSGCPNTDRYFSPQALETIDIDAPALAVDRIRTIVASDLYAERRPAVKEAKRRVLYEHNLFAMLTSIIEAARQVAPPAPARITLHPEPAAADKARGGHWVATALNRCFARRRP